MTIKKVSPISPNPEDKLLVSVDKLVLDDENPRFAGTSNKLSQSDLLKKISKEGNLAELIISFVANGFYEAEPLLAVKERGGRCRIIEGNRRAAALLLISNKELAKNLGYDTKDLFSGFSAAASKKLLENIPVWTYPSRDSLWSYLGYRHVKGAMRWDSYSKGVFILNLFDKKIPMSEIAERTGEKQGTTMRRLFNGMRILQQAESLGHFSKEDHPKLSFSHLYTLLDYDNAREYLGVRGDSKGLFGRNPVPKKQKKNLKTLITLLFGNSELELQSVIKTQNPDLRKLDAVLASKKATSYLTINQEKHEALERAFQMTSQTSNYFEEKLLDALTASKEAKAHSHYFKGEKELLNITDELFDVVEGLKEELHNKDARAKR